MVGLDHVKLNNSMNTPSNSNTKYLPDDQSTEKLSKTMPFNLHARAHTMIFAMVVDVSRETFMFPRTHAAGGQWTTYHDALLWKLTPTTTNLLQFLDFSGGKGGVLKPKMGFLLSCIRCEPFG